MHNVLKRDTPPKSGVQTTGVLTGVDYFSFKI